MTERLWILYDERACSGDTERAAVLSSSIDEREAKKDAKMFACPLACYSYRIDGDALVDEKWEWNQK